jgi:predicted transcriptional regulator
VAGKALGIVRLNLQVGVMDGLRPSPPARYALGMVAIRRSTPEMLGDALSVPERVLLFCVATRTDWLRAGITHTIARQMMVRGLIERQAAGNFTLTDQGRAVMEALMMRMATRSDDYR